MIKFSDHSRHVYAYDATGKKLRAEYHTPIMVVTEPQVPDMGEEMPEQEDVLMEEQQQEWNEEEWEEWEMEEETEEPQPQPNEPPAPSPIGNAPPPVSGNGNEEIILPVIPGDEPVTDDVPCEVTTVDYCGDFIYVNSKLKRMLFPGGYVTFRNDSIEHPEYHFYITDHQGNVRVVANQNGEVEQVNHYYPYGGLMGESTNSDAQPYKYNGKELDRHHGLDWFDYGARWYNGYSWTTPDPLAEKYYDTSPYVYCDNNPMRYIDPDGRKIVGVTKNDANTFKQDIHHVLADEKFAGIRTLIDVKGKEFVKIDAEALSNALNGVSLSTDERAYIDIVINTINSEDVHTFEFIRGEHASLKGSLVYEKYMNLIGEREGQKDIGTNSLDRKTGTLHKGIIAAHGGGLNVHTKKGSHSFIIRTGTQNELSVRSGHEIFGHGIPSAKRLDDAANNANAIRTDNLIRRLLSMPQRDGSDHHNPPEPYILPITQ